MRRGGRGGHRRQQQSVEQLLRDDLERRAELGSNRRRGEPFIDMERSCDSPGKQQLAGEQVHLDLAPLPAAIIDNAIHSDRRRLRRAARIDRRRRVAIRIVAELDMTNLVRHEEGLLECGTHTLVKDQIIGGDEGRAGSVEDGCPGRRRFDIDPSPLGLRDCKVIGRPGVGARCDEASVKFGGDLPGELHAVHVSPRPPTTGRASLPGRRRRSAPAQA